MKSGSIAASPGMRVVILGGGHAGVSAARELLGQRRSADRLDVTLVSADSALVWQGLLPQIVSNLVQPQDALVPLRRTLPGATIYPYQAVDVDLGARTVTLDRGPDRGELQLAYDKLVIAVGMVTDHSKVPGLAEHGLPLKTIGDAFHLRNHLIEMLELASVERDPAERERLLTFVVAGAGFAGVETACEIAGLARDALRAYPMISRSAVRVVLLNPGTRILPAMHEELATLAQRQMARWRIEIRHGARITTVTAGAVHLADTTILTRTLVATTGLGPSPLVTHLPLELSRGRIACDPYCRVPGWSGVYAAGDAAAVPSPSNGKPFPETISSAGAEGLCAARNILAEIRGTPLQPCESEHPQLALLSRTYGLADVRGRRRVGLWASLLWRWAFLRRIPSWYRRTTLAFDWLSTAAFPRDVTEVRIASTGAVISMRYAAGEIIVRQGEPGGRFYMITEGEVDVLREEADGTEVVLNRLGPGRYFGEIALLRGTRRNATVRALTEVSVLGVARRDFTALAAHLPLFRDAVSSTSDAPADTTKNGERGADQ
ncbi:MAG TPA: FAD-dependent oxidoreductase [Candidatus Limnocylindrales bacterium]